MCLLKKTFCVFLVSQCNWRFFTYEKKCRKSHGCTQKVNAIFPRVNKNQKQKNSLSIGWYFHIFQIFSIVLLNFIFEKVGWLQNMKSNFNVFFLVFTSIFLLSFLPCIRFFWWNFIFEKDDWLQNMKSIFSSFFPLFFVIFYWHFHHLKMCFGSRIERNCRVSKLNQVLRSRFLMIFGHFYHL